jgi:excisionase family DNA binding protein
MENPYLTLQEVADLLRVSIDTVRNYVNRKANPLPAYKLGREYRVLKVDLDNWLKKQKNVQEE